MGWDLLVIDGKDAPASLQNAPRDWSPALLGSAAKVRTRISAVIPTID